MFLQEKHDIRTHSLLKDVLTHSLVLQAKHDQRKEATLPTTQGDLAKNGSNGSNGYVASSVLLQQNGFSNGASQNHFVAGAASRQPASVTRTYWLSAHSFFLLSVIKYFIQ